MQTSEARRSQLIPERPATQNDICVACGTQFGASVEPPPSNCPICEDERQYVRLGGQSWTSLHELKGKHRNVVRSLEPGLTEIVTEPQFAIGQRALLVQTPEGNVLWDCVSLIDEETIAAVEALGGISSLAMSHPHMFGSMVAWSHAFGGAPIRLHASNERWVQQPDAVIEYWDEESQPLRPGVTLHRVGGHFTGSTVLHWSHGAEGRLSAAPLPSVTSSNCISPRLRNSRLGSAFRLS